MTDENAIYVIHSFLTYSILYELEHDKTNKMTCAPIEDSYHPGRPPILITVFDVCLKQVWVLSYP